MLSIPAAQASEAMQWALEIIGEARASVAQPQTDATQSDLLAVECWLADEDPPGPYALAS